MVIPRLKHITNPEKSIEIILTALKSTAHPSDSMTEESPIGFEHTSQFLCGKVGIELLAGALKELSFNRMHLCRDLFILLKLMDKVNHLSHFFLLIRSQDPVGGSKVGAGGGVCKVIILSKI